MKTWLAHGALYRFDGNVGDGRLGDVRVFVNEQHIEDSAQAHSCRGEQEVKAGAKIELLPEEKLW